MGNDIKDKTLYESRIVCFLDILGFSKLINSSTEDEIHGIKQALNSMKLSVDLNMSEQSGWQSLQFSDNIAMSILSDYSEQSLLYLVSRAYNIMTSLVFRGYTCRGGIAIGKLYQDGKTIFGPALVKAYEIESNCALYPRILIDNDVMLYARGFASYHMVDEYLNYDSDGFYYIDFTKYSKFKLEIISETQYLLKLYDIIVKGLLSNNVKIYQKYRWMATQYNKRLENLYIGFDEGAALEELLREDISMSESKEWIQKFKCLSKIMLD